MSYFLKEGSQNNFNDDNNNLENIYAEVCDICLKNLMLSSDAYVCMSKINMKGYKRLHRCLSKKFYNLYLELQSNIIDRFGKINRPNIDFSSYNVTTLEEHLTSWTESIEEDLVDIGNLIKCIFDCSGYMDPLAVEIQRILYKNKIKNEQFIKELSDCNWSFEAIYKIDYHLNNKFKAKEAS